MSKNTIFYINPQSKSNMAVYDYSLLNNVKNSNIYYICNKAYDYKTFDSVKVKKLFNYMRYKNRILKLLSYIFSILKVLAYAVAIKPDKVHIQWARVVPLDYLMYKLLKSFTKCKIVYTVHNVLPHNYKEKDIAGYKKIYNLVDYLIVHTEKSKQELISELGINQKKIHVIQHGPIKFDVDEQQLADKKKEFIETLGLDGKIVFSLMGSQSFYKGTDLLYNVWCETPGLANNTDIVCIIAGKPDATICIDYRLKPNNLLFLNRSLDYCEFQAIMELTNVAILPYRDISQSGILLSLVESNIPYCATPVGELLKPLTISNIAWAFDGINKNDIANKIIEISSDKDAITAKKSDVEGWNKVKLFYSWEKAGQLTSEIYEN